MEETKYTRKISNQDFEILKQIERDRLYAISEEIKSKNNKPDNYVFNKIKLEGTIGGKSL